MIAKTGLFFTQNRQELVPEDDLSKHKLAYVPGQTIAAEHEALIKQASSVENKAIRAAPNKSVDMDKE